MNMLSFTNSILKRANLEHEEKWLEIVPQMPQLQFPADWKVTIIPPFRGAVVRFKVELPSGTKKSIYADFYNRLADYDGNPYWEVYPYQDDVGRCSINDVTTLMEYISDET